jgi:membrane-bound serine protease (ClpP class)
LAGDRPGRVIYAIIALLVMSGAVAVFSLDAAAAPQQPAKQMGLLPPGSPYNGSVGPTLIYIKINGVIDNAMRDYVINAIHYAERRNCPLVLVLDTPGGYLDAAIDIVLAIDDSGVPVIGFVERGWALSAGTLILVSTHVAAMAPGTQIGSMQPVMYDPTTGKYEPINESKIINPILKFLDEHAATKGRNVTQLHRFVTHNDNLGAYEALRYHVIEVVASNLGDLAAKLNGSVVKTKYGSFKLVLDGSVEEYTPGLHVRLLHVLSDPILAGILLTLGTLIILFTLASGHAAFAAIGAILLLLGLAGNGFNPNYTALILIILGATLIFIEINTPGFGVIGGTGIVMLLLGIALLPVSPGGFTISEEYAKHLLLTLYGTGAAMGLFSAFIVYKIIEARRKPPMLWSIIGAHGKAVDEISPNTEGFVIVEGEYWKARSAGPKIAPGEEVVVVGKDGPTLIVDLAHERGGRQS